MRALDYFFVILTVVLLFMGSNFSEDGLKSDENFYYLGAGLSFLVGCYIRYRREMRSRK